MYEVTIKGVVRFQLVFIIIIKSDFFFQPTHLAICHVVMGEDKDGSKRR